MMKRKERKLGSEWFRGLQKDHLNERTFHQTPFSITIGEVASRTRDNGQRGGDDIGGVTWGSMGW